MPKMILAFSFLFILLSPVCGQTARTIEDRLLVHLKNIGKWSNYGLDPDTEKLDRVNAAFKKDLLLYTQRPATLAYSFPRLKKELNVATSNDGKFRIYSWDEGTGGSMHEFSSVVQYKAADGSVRSSTLQSGGFFHDMFQVEGQNGSIYLGVATFIASGASYEETIKAFKIVGMKVDSDVRVIRTGKGLQSAISFGYDASTAKGKKLFTFNQVGRSFSFPVVIDNGETSLGQITNKRMTYKFDGRNFVKSE